MLYATKVHKITGDALVMGGIGIAVAAAVIGGVVGANIFSRVEVKTETGNYTDAEIVKMEALTDLALGCFHGDAQACETWYAEQEDSTVFCSVEAGEEVNCRHSYQAIAGEVK